MKSKPDHFQPTNVLAVLVVSLFFVWGGITSLNDVLIPKLKALFTLSYTEAMLVQLAFFSAYFVVSLPAGWVVTRVGYIRGIVAGLIVMAVGCLLFIPAANTALYSVFLTALFVLACGITLLQVAANPLIAQLGSQASSHSRLTFAQAFNSLGTTLAPYIGAKLMLSADHDGMQMQPSDAATNVSESYVAIAVSLLVLSAVFWWLRKARLGDQRSEVAANGIWGMLSNRRLAFGVIAMFLYVGAEVTIGSLLVNYLAQPSVMGLTPAQAGERIALYWGGAMVGRFIGVALLKTFSPGQCLGGAALGATVLAISSSMTVGPLAGWLLIAVGLMNSIMFPTIFALSIEGLGERTAQGSGLLCMAIVGGAVVPVIGGLVADGAGLHVALWVPALCYAFIALFGARVSKLSTLGA